MGVFRCPWTSSGKAYIDYVSGTNVSSGADVMLKLYSVVTNEVIDCDDPHSRLSLAIDAVKSYVFINLLL